MSNPQRKAQKEMVAEAMRQAAAAAIAAELSKAAAEAASLKAREAGRCLSVSQK